MTAPSGAPQRNSYEALGSLCILGMGASTGSAGTTMLTMTREYMIGLTNSLQMVGPGYSWRIAFARNIFLLRRNKIVLTGVELMRSSILESAKEIFESKVSSQEIMDTWPLEKLQTLSTKILDRMAFGFTVGSILTLNPDDLSIKYEDDLENAKYQAKASGPDKWAKSVNLSKPIDIFYEKGKLYVGDGHHRWYASKLLGKQVRAKVVDIKDNPALAIIQMRTMS